MKTTWVLVAEKSRARLFDWQSRDVLNEIQAFVHPESRLHEQDLVSDRRGRAFDSAGEGRHAQQEPTSAKQHEAEVFARELVTRLDQSRSRQELDRLVIMAAPQFLGQLREEMPPELQKLVIREVNKNLAQESADDIRRYLPEVLPV
jgi:protein required for attachment to host cells